jgi:hypothetical protein
MVSMKFMTNIALFSDHLTELFGVELNVGRKVPEHFVFDYTRTDWVLFRRELDARMDLIFHSIDLGLRLTLTLWFMRQFWRRELLRFLLFVQVVFGFHSPRKSSLL